MVILEKSNRIKNIENRFNGPIKDLLYQMHWMEDMKHTDIGTILNIPRVTVTKWFHQFKLPTQSCRRFTDKNLTSWLYKTGKLKKKPRYTGPDRRIQKTKGGLNVDFFKKWSPEMAYVLGYFAADGYMFTNSGGSKYISFVSIDKEILENIKIILKSKHKIKIKKQSRPNCKRTFWLQIGCREIYNDIIKLGLLPNKECRLEIPHIPKVYFKDFLRGYFDGDGCISYGHYKRKNRKSRILLVSVRFASATKEFLNSIKQRLRDFIYLKGGFITKSSGCHYLVYSKNDGLKLFKYMYDKIDSRFYLKRKYNKFLKVLNMGPWPSLV